MTVFRNPRSISTKLTRMNFMVSATALLLACASFFGYDLLSFRQSLLSSLTTEAQITAANTVTALMFDDQQAASATLSALSHSPRIMAGAIYTENGQPFAAYTREGATPIGGVSPLKPGQRTARWTDRNKILLGSRIEFQGNSIGTVYILAETSEVFQHVRNYALISGAILLLCLLCALFVASTFRRVLASPLIGLAETARVVTNRKDYSIRAAQTCNVEEISTLVSSFNAMLMQIEERDQALQQAKEELEQRVLERTSELTATNKELEAFSYSVAHDLRGPLDVIGNIGFLLQHSPDLPADEAIQKLLGELQLGTRKMAALIDDLLNLSRSTRAGLHSAPINLSEMASAIARNLQDSEPHRKVRFKIDPGSKVIADETLMGVVLENLLRNAWKYTSRREDATIQFGMIAGENECIYFVRDNGAGFDPQLADRLFQPFQRLHTNSEFPGTGIGLATVQRIVARHGGRVWAEGDVGRGATFYFTLPEVHGG